MPLLKPHGSKVVAVTVAVVETRWVKFARRIIAIMFVIPARFLYLSVFLQQKYKRLILGKDEVPGPNPGSSSKKFPI